MVVSDLITLYALIIAIVALISERNRGFILLKFWWPDYLLLAIIFFTINYLVFFDYFLKSELFVSALMVEHYPQAKDWAYVVTLITVLYLVVKLISPAIPGANTSHLKEYYTNLLFNNEHLEIIALFEKYHKEELLQYLRTRRSDNEKTKQAVIIFDEIISRDDFIAKTANLRPYFYTDMVSFFTKRNYYGEEFIYTYIYTLMEEKNQFLFREIKNNQNYESPSFHYRLPDENKILRALLVNLKVVEETQACKAFADAALSELVEEAKKKGLSEFNHSYQDEDFIWTTRIYNTIWFFDIMVRKGIHERTMDHLWIYYYRNFTMGILDTLCVDEANQIDQNAEFPTNNHKLLFEIISNLREWILRCGEIGSASQHVYSITCLGTCIPCIAISNKLSQKFKNYILEMYIEIYFDIHGYEHLLTEFLKVTLNPPFRQYNEEYVTAFIAAWDQFDRFPHQNHPELLDSFETDVISVLRASL